MGPAPTPVIFTWTKGFADKMAVKWIICDVDGCLAPEESEAWDLEAFAELARAVRCRKAGGPPLAPITLCTGRPQPYAEVLMKLLDVRAPAICENGAVIYTLHNNHARFGPGVTLDKIADLRRLRAYLDTEILPREPAAVLQFGKEAQISVFSEQPSIFPAMKAQIEAYARENQLPPLHITASHYYLNISLDGVDKGHALDALLDELGVTGGEVAGIGDTEGDLPLRQRVGFFACPANATPALKAVADYVSPYPTTAGMQDILQRPELCLA